MIETAVERAFTPDQEAWRAEVREFLGLDNRPCCDSSMNLTGWMGLDRLRLSA